VFLAVLGREGRTLSLDYTEVVTGPAETSGGPRLRAIINGSGRDLVTTGVPAGRAV
jgi:hypothetical protein